MASATICSKTAMLLLFVAVVDSLFVVAASVCVCVCVFGVLYSFANISQR